MEIAEFVVGCVEEAGGLADRPSANVLEALVPQGLGMDTQPDGVVRMALDGDAASRHRDALPVLPGSPALDGFIEYALERGRLTRGTVRTERLRPRDIAGDILSVVTFTAGRVRMPQTPADIAMGAVAHFDFIVALTSDERQESLQSVVVDLVGGVPCPILSRRAWALDVDLGAVSAAGPRVTCALADAHGIALRALEEWTAPRIDRRQDVVARRLRDEYARLQLYYEATVEDLRRRAARADGERAAGLKERVQATRREEEAKLAELGEKYQIRPSARLAAARLLTYPRLFSTVYLDRKQTSRALELSWDPVTAQLRLPVCESCRHATPHIEMTRTDRLLCPACVATGQ